MKIHEYQGKEILAKYGVPIPYGIPAFTVAEAEAAAAKHPEKILREAIHPCDGWQPYQGRDLAKRLGLSGDAAKSFGTFLAALVKAYLETDAAIFEVNPLVVTKQGKVFALDAKVN